MKYPKTFKTFEAQAELLISRGLEADRALLIERLRAVNYYRLSGYLFPFKDKGDHLRSGTTFEMVWRRYTFDRRLRLIVFDAIERIEIKARTVVAYIFAQDHEPFAYADAAIFPRLTPDRHAEWFEHVCGEARRSNEVFKKHFFDKYGDTHQCLPIWVAAEIMSFGNVVRAIKGYDAKMVRSWATEVGVPDKVLESWLLSLNYVRNLCAHHSRLWDRSLSMKPLLPDKRKEWHEPVRLQQDRLFVILSICAFMLKSVAPQSRWKNRLFELLEEYSDMPEQEMGFPKNWKENPIWK